MKREELDSCPHCVAGVGPHYSERFLHRERMRRAFVRQIAEQAAEDKDLQALVLERAGITHPDALDLELLNEVTAEFLQATERLWKPGGAR